jgi:hypothetical protein
MHVISTLGSILVISDHTSAFEFQYYTGQNDDTKNGNAINWTRIPIGQLLVFFL